MKELSQQTASRLRRGYPHRCALEPLADDANFQRQWRDVKLANKRRLAALIAERTGIAVAPESLFDVQVKRIHEVGAENFFLFGLTTEEVEKVKAGGYGPRDCYEKNSALREVIDFVASGALGRGDRELFRSIVENLLDQDPFLLLADYPAYIDAHERVSALWRDPQAWTRSSILNAARTGKFSSDRSIRDYCDRVWNIKPGH